MSAGRAVLVLSSLLLAGPAFAQGQVIDQMQPLVDTAFTLAIGGGPGSEQQLAQTVTAALDGDMSALFLPVACASGRLVIEIRDVVGDLPGSTVRLRRRVPASALPAVGLRFRRVALGGRVPVAAGDRFAIVLSNPTGSCGLTRSVAGDSYVGGAAFFDARPNPPGWIPLGSDLAFMQIVVP